MDALTSSSADRGPGSNRGYGNGRSGEANAASAASASENQGDWDWFSPAKPHSSADPANDDPATGDFSDSGQREAASHQRSADGGNAGIPSRTPTAIRPVGSTARRTEPGDQEPPSQAPWATERDVPPPAEATRPLLPTRPRQSARSAAEAAAMLSDHSESVPQQRGPQHEGGIREMGAPAPQAARPETPTRSEGSWFDPSPAHPAERQQSTRRTEGAPQPAAEARPPEPTATWGQTPPVPGVHTPPGPGATSPERPGAAGQFMAPLRPTTAGDHTPREHGGMAERQPTAPARPSAAPEPQLATGSSQSASPGPAATARQSAAPARGVAPEAPTPREEPKRTPAATARAAASEAAPSADAILIRRTMEAIEPVADKTTSYFYASLFLRNPELRDLFPAAMDVQRDRLFKALLTAAKHVDDIDTLTEYLSNLGRGHRKYGARPEHYPAVGECLIGALTRYASDVWNEEVEAAWVRAYTTISQIMIDAAAAAELTSPAWWQAEIVSHERRTQDIAVITVRPDQPYPFLAGQYTSVETPWWPRVWRHYSFASAPRPDGLLSFHIKAVPAGWVSSALVNRARPGDVIRLGPPAGSMIVDHGTDNGLLCLGGGTGIAPIKALIEDVAEHGRRRAVEVFYGARSGHDLYDLDTMLRLEQEYGWLSVRPVVSEGPSDGLVGPLSEVVSRCGPWHSYDAYLSGPAGMIRSSVDALVGIGMPAHRIRHDSVAELVGVADH
jgi:NAD(P)H-flavin reductase/hemoglobin-like flavoprotein